MSDNKPQNSNFIVQGGILAVAGIISRIIGFIYRIPLQNTIGDAGMGYYSAAFQIYSIMLIISSYSLPVAVSKLVAARAAKGQYRNARRFFHGALFFATLTGGATCLIVLFGADTLAGNIMRMPKSAIALRMLAPTLLIVALMGVIRGYFQGLGTMVPTAFSQLLEQIVNAVVSIAAGLYLYEYGTRVSALLRDEAFAPAWGAAGGTLGTGAGALSGLLVLLVMFIVHKRKMRRYFIRDNAKYVDSYGRIFSALIVTVLPVILSTTIYNISDTLDQAVFNYVMDVKGFASIKAEYWGIYAGKYRVLTNVPIALANALCSSMMPSLAACMENGERRQARHKVAIGTRFVMIISIPCAVALAILGRPLISLMFTGEVEIPAMLLRMGSASVIFYSLSTLSNGVLQGIDKMRIPVRNAAIALVLHMGILYVTIGIFDWKLYGVVASTMAFGLLMCILNWVSIAKHLRYHQEVRRTFVIPVIASAVMGGIVWLLYFILSRSSTELVSVIIASVVGAIVYFVVLMLLRGIRESEIRSLPGGGIVASIAKLFRLL
ncbi:MAG: polysaccharide biosynthesis protein [Lachnospiraceae bacterium]|nr:polysaccharide biosynthesis protein [Lachnospiraceae bacterium]